jgi:hypothetical protein
LAARLSANSSDAGAGAGRRAGQVARMGSAPAAGAPRSPPASQTTVACVPMRVGRRGCEAAAFAATTSVARSASGAAIAAIVVALLAPVSRAPPRAGAVAPACTRARSSATSQGTAPKGGVSSSAYRGPLLLGVGLSGAAPRPSARGAQAGAPTRVAPVAQRRGRRRGSGSSARGPRAGGRVPPTHADAARRAGAVASCLTPCVCRAFDMSERAGESARKHRP